MMQCDICNRMGDDLVPLMFPIARDLKWICRHGHFEGTAVSATTGLPLEMTGSWLGLTWPRAFSFRRRLLVRLWAFLEALRSGWPLTHAMRLALMR